MELRKFVINRKNIKFRRIVNPDEVQNKKAGNASEDHTITCHEAPLPELTKSFAALSPVFCELMELDPTWQDGLNIYRLEISYTKAGTRSVQFYATKQLEIRNELLHRLSAPMIQIDKPADGESGEVQVKDKKHLASIMKAIQEAEKYAKGERSQVLLDFDEGRAALQATADQGQGLLGAM